MLTRQFYHLLFLIILVAGVYVVVQYDEGILSGDLYHVPTSTWFIIAMAFPIVHQVYVLICWRLELYYKLLTRAFGPNVFRSYKIGFFILFAGRMVFIILLAVANRNTFYIPPLLNFAFIGILVLIGSYAFYSVKKYFGMDRAAGLDHFDESISKMVFVKKGIFKYTNNGMYMYAFLLIYIPPFLFLSEASLLVAVFSHLYIWVHYYCTEIPDIKTIYKSTPS